MHDWSLAQFLYSEMYNGCERTKRHIIIEVKLTWTHQIYNPLWRHQMETFSALVAICAENSSVNGEFPTHRPVTRSFDDSLICAWIVNLLDNREVGDLKSSLWLRCNAHGGQQRTYLSITNDNKIDIKKMQNSKIPLAENTYSIAHYS